MLVLQKIFDSSLTVHSPVAAALEGAIFKLTPEHRPIIDPNRASIDFPCHTRSGRSTSLVQIPAERPYLLSLASCTASASESKTIIVSTGPKTSSCMPDALIPAIQNGKVDVAAVYGHCSEPFLNGTTISVDECVLAVPKGHRLASSRRAVSLQ